MSAPQSCDHATSDRYDLCARCYRRALAAAKAEGYDLGVKHASMPVKGMLDDAKAAGAREALEAADQDFVCRLVTVYEQNDAEGV